MKRKNLGYKNGGIEQEELKEKKESQNKKSQNKGKINECYLHEDQDEIKVSNYISFVPTNEKKNLFSVNTKERGNTKTLDFNPTQGEKKENNLLNFVMLNKNLNTNGNQREQISNNSQKINKVNKMPEVYIAGSELSDLAPLLNIFSILNVAKSICKIIKPNKDAGSGFLINLSSKEKPFYCLMTNEHVISENMIKEKETITFYYDNESERRTIKLENRTIKEFKKEINQELGDPYRLDATVVEILPEDNIDKEYFLLPNYDYIYNYNALNSKEITIVQYPMKKRESLCYSKGTISFVNAYEFTHLATTDFGSSGSPIFLKGTKKVIGIHSSGVPDTTNPRNFGNFIGPIYRYFNPSNEIDEFGNNDVFLRTIYKHVNPGENADRNSEKPNAGYKKESINIYNYIEALDEPIDYEKLILGLLKNAYK